MLTSAQEARHLSLDNLLPHHTEVRRFNPARIAKLWTDRLVAAQGYQSNQNAYASSTSPPINPNQQWAPPTQSPPPAQQQWNQPPVQSQMQPQSQQGWAQSAASPPRQPQQPQQQQVASSYNPNVYGVMPGAYNQGGQQPPPVPVRYAEHTEVTSRSLRLIVC